MAPDNAGLALHPDAGAADDLADDVAALAARWQAIEAARARARAPAPLEPEEPLVADVLAAFAAPDLARILVDDRRVFAEARAWLQRHHPALVNALAFHAGPRSLFESEGVAAEIEGALGPRVALPGGGALIVAATHAATLIDVDGGAALATNLAAAREAAHQVRLRNLAGPIVIDFIGMKSRRARGEVGAALAAALAGDPGRPQLLGWTRLGHMELVRKRRHPPLEEILFETAGPRAKTPLTVALEALRAAQRAASLPGALTLALHPDIVALLRDGPAARARAALEARLGQPLALVAEPARPREAFDIRRG